jgi:ectoine hydroxylase-related dioxygenase (phytanoyl-CoA dioxygenase family)
MPVANNSSTAIIKNRFHQNGFVIIQDLIPEKTIDSVKSEIKCILDHEAERHLGVHPSDAERFDTYLKALFALDSNYRGRLYQVLQSTVSLYQFATFKKVLDVAEVLGDVQAPNIRNVGVRIDIPGEDEFLQPLHQDVNSMRSKNCLNYWMPLQKVTRENGALRVFRGSHKLGPIPAAQKQLNASGYESIPRAVIEDYEEIYCTIEPTDAVVFHPYLVHGSETNRSERTRWTVITRLDWLLDGINPYASLRRTDAK